MRRTVKASSQLRHAFGWWPAAIAVGLCLACGERVPAVSGVTDRLVVHRGALARRYLLTGALEAVEGARLTVPKTREHRLQIQWLAPDGSTVVAGDRVLEFDNSSFTADLDQQRAAVQRSLRGGLQLRAQGDASLRDAEAAVERARITLAKAELDASIPESVRSRYDHRNAQLALARARADYDKAVAGLESTAAKVEADIRIAEEQHRRIVRGLEEAETAVDELLLTAPRGGILVVERHPWEDRKFQAGDTVFTGWDIVGIPDLERLRVRAALSDVDDGRLSIGMIARCTPDIEPDLHLAGRIAEITPIAREQRWASERRGFDVVIDLEPAKTDILLVPGMSVRVEVDVPGEEGLLVPRAAVDLSSSPPRVRRPGDSWVEVRLGECSVQECVVLEGLLENESVAAIVDLGS
jgi:multidrug efflux pump subunit AcrA (membrane-fusion protein)